MSVDSSTLIVLDASCIVAGVRRPEGGAGLIMRFCRRRLLKTATSAAALIESERSIISEFGDSALAAYHLWLINTPIEVVYQPSQIDIRVAQGIVEPKDEHVLAAALSCKARFLISHDKRLVRAVNEADLPISALDPGLFIIGVMPAHRDFDALRD